MHKIKDLVVGGLVDITLVVVNATARETKAKKPYLQLELYDGTNTIQGNYWDWTSGKVPDKNSIVDISCQVTEYLGAKQLNIKTLKLNTERHLSEFEPKSGVDISGIYKEAYALVSNVSDDFLRELALQALEQLQSLWCSVPGAKGVHHAFVGGTLVHSVSVAKIALAISQQMPDANEDLCIVGGLLHDIGKLFTYKINGITIDMTDEGMLYDHTFIGAEFIGSFAEENKLVFTEHEESMLRLLRHIILSHHGKLEYGAAVPPLCIEAYIVHSADGIDATAQQIREKSVEGAMWTEKIFTLSNRPHLSTQYVKEVMSNLPL